MSVRNQRCASLRRDRRRRSSPRRRPIASEHNQVVFQVAKTATKPQIKAAVEACSTSRSTRVNTLVRKGKNKRVPRRRGHAVGREEGGRDARRGSRDRRDDRAVRRGLATMALKTFKPVTPGLRQLVIVDRSELYKGKPVKALTEGKSSVGRAQQPRPHHRALPRRRPQADATASSISSVASSTCRPRSSGSNTIRTAPRSSR